MRDRSTIGKVDKMTTWYKCKNCSHNIADYSEGYKRKPPYYLHVNPGAGRPDQDCLCGCTNAEIQTGKYECKWCHYRSDIKKDIEDHVQERHNSILKEGTQEEIWKQVIGYNQKAEQKRLKKLEKEQKIKFKEEDEENARDTRQYIKDIRDDFVKNGGNKLSFEEILEICNVEWRSRGGNNDLLKKLIEHGYLEKKGFFGKFEMTTKGKSIYDYVDLTLKYFLSVGGTIKILDNYEVMRGSPTEQMKKHGFTISEINWAKRFDEAFSKYAKR